MSTTTAKGVVKTSKVDVAISESADLGDLILVVQETIKLQRAGYALKDNPFSVLFGKTLEFFKEESAIGGSDEVLGRSVETLELSVRTYNCLKNANIPTLGRLVEKTEAELLATKNFGRRSLNEIRNLLSELGLSLKH